MVLPTQLGVWLKAEFGLVYGFRKVDGVASVLLSTHPGPSISFGRG
jgi:hypothetical protein